MSRAATALVPALLLALLAGCGGPPPLHVDVVVVSTVSSAENLTVELWGPDNQVVLHVDQVLQGSGQVALGSFDGKVGAYTGRARVGTYTHVQEGIHLPEGTTVLYVLAGDGRADFSLDGTTPL